MLSSTRRWSEKFVIKHPWHDVVSSVQFKYPNPYNPNVLNIDVLNRYVDPSSGIMHSCKLINSSWPMFHMGHLRALEYSCVHVPEKRMISKTINIDLQGVLDGLEQIEYTVHPENKDWTVLEHSISVEAFSLIAMSAISMCKQTAYQGREALDWVISHRLPTIQSSRSSQYHDSIPADSTDSSYSDSLSSTSSSNLFAAGHSDSPVQKWEQVTASSPSTKSCASSFFTEISRQNATSTKFAQDIPLLPQPESLGSRLETFSRDVSVITDNLVKRSQRVAHLFSRIDEYVVIL